MIYLQQSDHSFRCYKSHVDLPKSATANLIYACLPFRPDVYTRIETVPAKYDARLGLFFGQLVIVENSKFEGEWS